MEQDDSALPDNAPVKNETPNTSWFPYHGGVEYFDSLEDMEASSERKSFAELVKAFIRIFREAAPFTFPVLIVGCFIYWMLVTLIPLIANIWGADQFHFLENLGLALMPVIFLGTAYLMTGMGFYKRALLLITMAALLSDYF